MAERNLDTHPYSKDEQRVVDWLWERGFGGGDDPIEFILVSHAYIINERNLMKAVAKAAHAYRKAEQDGTPRLWRGKPLQDLANILDDALEVCFPEEE